MAEQLYFSRDSKCYIEFDGVVWEIPVLDGFSFSQGNNTSEITLSEMESSGGVSRRGRRAFNDSLAPGEWSISTYVRPFLSSGSGNGAADGAAEVHAVEEILWAMMAGADSYDGTTFDFDRGGSNVITPATTNSVVSFDQSNKSTLGTANIYFVLGNSSRSVFKLKDSVVNEASLDFEIDGIATISWSGQCSEVLDFTGSTIESETLPVFTATTQDGTTIAVGDVWLDSNDGHRLYTMTDTADTSEEATAYINEKITDTSNFIRNRLTTLTVTPTSQDQNNDGANEFQSSYNLTLTGGNVTISNNVTYITPEELGVVNIPVGHVTGARSVSGSFTCYLTRDTSSFDSDKSRDLFEDLRNASSVVTNSFGLVFSIGGGSGTRLELNCATAHLEIPTHSIEDVISIETNFMALPQTIDDTDEIVLTYKV